MCYYPELITAYMDMNHTITLYFINRYKYYIATKKERRVGT
jgi:hypothetical protein